MPEQKYVITKYSKTIHPNTYRQLRKQARFLRAVTIYGVERLRPSGDELIGYYESLLGAKHGVTHHARRVMKNTTGIQVRLNAENGFKNVVVD